MKIKKICLFAAAALALASCSSSDELGGSTSSQKAIQFAAPFVGKTRATGDLDVNTIQNAKVSVWGDQYVNSYNEDNSKSLFNGGMATLSYNTTSTNWDLNKIAFWEDGYKYDFTAVAPAAAEDGFKAAYSKGLLTISNIPVVQTIGNGDVKGGDDILVATKTGLDSSMGDVQLSFRHILSRFSIYAYTSMGEENPVTITKLTLYMPKATATYQQNSHNDGAVSGSDTWAWTGFTNSTTATKAEDLKNSYEAYEVITEANKMNVTYNASASSVLNDIKLVTEKTKYLCPKEFFIAPTALYAPASTESLQLYMDITYEMDGVQEEKFVPVQDLHAFKQGYQTNLIIDIENKATQPISFQNFIVNDWADSSNGTTVIQ